MIIIVVLAMVPFGRWPNFTWLSFGGILSFIPFV
jgi:hypothetical protein